MAQRFKGEEVKRFRVQGLSNSDFGMRNAELKTIKTFRGSGPFDFGFRIADFGFPACPG
jgi:hypothetical protein